MRYRTEQDSMGKINVPDKALYGAQTQRALNNFDISGLPLPSAFISAVALIKACAAEANADLGVLAQDTAKAISRVALQISKGKYRSAFPVEVFQTGSGTSTNMNVNEVIATLASRHLGRKVHPNDHVNLGQSSNDVIPSAIHISATLMLREQLLPALKHLQQTIERKAATLQDVVKTGRTHLMDGMPITMAQEMSAWSEQFHQCTVRLEQCLPRLQQLAQGGSAVGTGINTHPEFALKFSTILSHYTGVEFTPNPNFFTALSSQDTAVELSGQLKVTAAALMKVANDLRWMNSGPLTGLAEITLEPLQPGSSIMPGKINPVAPEAVTMVAAQVIGNDSTITVAGQSGNFQLNLMLPLIAYNLLQSIQISTGACRLLADKAIKGLQVNCDRIANHLARNPVLITALTPRIGYEKAAKIAKTAYQQQRSVLEVAVELSGLEESELAKLLDPYSMV